MFLIWEYVVMALELQQAQHNRLPSKVYNKSYCTRAVAMAMVLINCIHHQDLLVAQMLQDGLILQAGFCVCVCVWVCFVFQMVMSSSQSSARVHDFELCSSHGCNSRRSRTSFDSKHRLVFMWFGTLTQTFILPFQWRILLASSWLRQESWDRQGTWRTVSLFVGHDLYNAVQTEKHCM
jgi:hypothetical protein